jgi:hypothetical protein
MYVQKADLRAAVARQLDTIKGQNGKTLRQQAEDEVRRLDKELKDFRLELFTRLAADPKTVAGTKADEYNDRLITVVKVSAGDNAKMVIMQDKLSEARRRMYDLQNKVRYASTTPLELEAWLVRLDNDVKTETVSIKREFAQELGLI